MLRPLFLLLVLLSIIQATQAQKKYINRKVAQKNYEGYMFMQKHEYDSALILFNNAILNDPKAFFIYQNRAICKMHLKDTLGAITDYKNNIKLDPNNSESRYALGNIYKSRKDSVNAVNYFVPAIKQANEEFSQKKLLYMNNFCGHYFRLKEDYDSALVFYDQVKKYTPKNASVFINSAVCNFHLDSIDSFCKDLEQAFILGGSVNCIALKSYCNGCNHLLEQRGGADTLSWVLDTRLAGIIPDTIYYHTSQNKFSRLPYFDNTKKVKVYFNKLWQICIPEKATFYREAFWAKGANTFGGQFTDYYINGQIYASGTIDKAKLCGPYKSYYKNGKLKIKGEFISNIPSGKWTFYLGDGTPDFEVEFILDEFDLNILNRENPYFQLNSGTGKFKLTLDSWGEIDFVLSGEYLNDAREGQWAYIQNKEKIISERYKKGKFKTGYVATNIGNINISSSRIDASTFVPPQLTQVAGLYFHSVEAANYYSFIQKSGF